MIVVGKDATTKDGLTLGDLIQFVQEAQQAGVDPRAGVKVRIGFRSQIQQISTGGTR